MELVALILGGLQRCLGLLVSGAGGQLQALGFALLFILEVAIGGDRLLNLSGEGVELVLSLPDHFVGVVELLSQVCKLLRGIRIAGVLESWFWGVEG
jgi:hypothetical protein